MILKILYLIQPNTIKKSAIYMNILITGTTGFIGKYLLRQLLKEGHNCRCLVRRDTTDTDVFFKRPDIELFMGDITRPETLNDIGKGIDIVFHLAAAGHVAAVSEEAYKDFYNLNVQGTKNIIKACSQNGVRRLIHFSSTAAMGTIKLPVIDEGVQCRPQTPYQKSKYESELTAFKTGKKFGLEVIVLRPCMVYGPGGQGEFLNFCRLIRKGVFPKIGTGKNFTPIVHVLDVAQAAVKAIENGKPGEVYLIASRTSPPLKEIHTAITKALEIKRIYFYVPYTVAYLFAYLFEKWASFRNKPPLVSRKNITSIVSGRIFSISKTSNDLDYNPDEDLLHGVKETVNWYQQMKLL